jgi:hypothetical protein
MTFSKTMTAFMRADPEALAERGKVVRVANPGAAEAVQPEVAERRAKEAREADSDDNAEGSRATERAPRPPRAKVDLAAAVEVVDVGRMERAGCRPRAATCRQMLPAVLLQS